ncbi:hypothetical protein [Streptomyces sp. LS1784]|uniref:hypothetical protein n=1 Tax=Streptomyces sp. LS1784 TaxID=2851533 RepID=UPI001CCF00C0|nr:hypothetical protein [Streptomyces sp. LS1784]
MYLVHTVLRPDAPSRALPVDARGILLAAVLPGDRVEHLVVHPDALPDPVLGVYLVADSLAEAEGRAAAFCRRALAAVPAFAGWSAAGTAAPLVAPFYEHMLSDEAGSAEPAGPVGPPDCTDPGRNGPGAFPST